MRRWILDLHLYLGLLCVPYVVVLGSSAILRNHDLGSSERTEWSASVGLPDLASPVQQAAAVQVALGITGKLRSQTAKHTAEGALQFQVVRPGRSYRVEVSANGAARVSESNGGLAGILRGLHGFGDRTGPLWTLGWSLYTDFAAGGLLLSIGSGAGLVLSRAPARTRGLAAGLLGTVVVVSLAAALW